MQHRSWSWRNIDLFHYKNPDKFQHTWSSKLLFEYFCSNVILLSTKQQYWEKQEKCELKRIQWWMKWRPDSLHVTMLVSTQKNEENYYFKTSFIKRPIKNQWQSRSEIPEQSDNNDILISIFNNYIAPSIAATWTTCSYAMWFRWRSPIFCFQILLQPNIKMMITNWNIALWHLCSF